MNAHTGMPHEQRTADPGSHPVARRCGTDALRNTTVLPARLNRRRGAHRYGWRWLAAVAPLAGLLGHALAQTTVQVTPVGQWPGYPRGPARAVAVSGNYAYVAADESGLMVIDISNLAHPVRVGGVTTRSAFGVAVAGQYAYVADGDAGLQVIDVSSPANPVRVGGHDTPGYAQDVAVAGQYAYVADSGAGLQVIDVSNPTNPVRVGGYDTSVWAYRVTVVGNYAYVADGLAGLHVIDVSHPASPVRVGDYNTPGGARRVAVAGNYAYLAGDWRGLQVIDVSNPAKPVRVGGYDTPGSAKGVAVAGHHAYVVDGWTGGLHVIDVSNPARPVKVGGHDTRVYAEGVTVAGDYAYVADGGGGLQVIDVSNPARPVRVGGADADTRGYALGVAVAGNYAYVADGWGLQAIDVSNPAKPVRVGGAAVIPGAWDVAVAGNYAYVADGWHGLQVFDVSDPAKPARVGGFDNGGGEVQGVAVAGNHAYVAAGHIGLRVIDVGNPANPARVGGWEDGPEYDPYARDVAVAGNYAYLAGPSLQVIDVSDPANPVWVAGYGTLGDAQGVAVAGHYAYVAAEGSGLHVIDVSDPANPVRVGGYDTPGSAWDVAVAGSYAYVADMDAGLQVIDVSNPARPVRGGGHDTPGYAEGVTVAGDYAYVADGDAGLQIFRIGDQQPPALVQFDYPVRPAECSWTYTGHFGGEFRKSDGTVLRGHLGDDLAAPKGTPVRAVADGKVSVIQPVPDPDPKRGFGGALLLEHPLEDVTTVYSLYAHLSRIHVAIGQEVSRGTVIGEVGDTGFATGPHLHLVIKDRPELTGGYSEANFAGDEVMVDGTRYYRPSLFIERRRQAPADGQATVVGAGVIGLSLRAAPGLAAERLRVIPEGSRVTVLPGVQYATGHSWRLVRHDGEEGWVAGQYLSFIAPAGSPPAAPGNLKQLAADGITPLAKQTETVERTVRLAATVMPAPGGQVKGQFEVRPAGSAFVRSTHESGYVSASQPVQVAVGGLAEGGYQWRVRAVDEGGQASDWIGFDSGGLADFSVRLTRPPSAQFGWSPAAVFVGELVEFRAAEPGQGLTFSWDFGDGSQAGSAQAVHAYAQPGEFRVTLTVTDADGTRASHGATMAVGSSALQDQIERLVDRCLAHLEEIATSGRELAAAAGYFQRTVNSAQTEVILGGVFDAISLGLDGAQLARLFELILLQEVAQTEAQEVVSWAAEAVAERIFGGATYQSLLLPNLEDYHIQQKSELLQLRAQALAAAATLPPDQVGLLARDLSGRTAGNTAAVTEYVQKAHLPLTFRQLKEQDENSWSLVRAERLFSVSLGFGVIATGSAAGLSGLAAFALSGFGTVSDNLWRNADILARQDTDGQMLFLAADLLGQGFQVSKRLADNARNGLTRVVTQTPAHRPAGRMAVEQITEGGIRVFGFERRWLARRAYSRVTVENTGPVAAVFRFAVMYPKRFTTAQLLPLAFGLGERAYDIHVLQVHPGIVLTAGASGTFDVAYLDERGGEVPGGLLTFTFSAVTGDGEYLLMQSTGSFGTTFIDETGTVLGEDEKAGLILAPVPVYSTLATGTTTRGHILTLHAANPFEMPVLMNLRQTLPADAELLATAGAVVVGNELVWELDLPPGASELKVVEFRSTVVAGGGKLPDGEVTLYDSVNAQWLSLNSVVRSAALREYAPPVLVTPLELTGSGAGIWLRAPTPGVYRLEVSTNLVNWLSVGSMTNASGRLLLHDTKGGDWPQRFYRARLE